MTESYVNLLRELTAQIDVQRSANPHLDACERLLDGEGAGTVLATEAAEVWEQIVAASEGDGLSLHHLAIIYHGQAYEFERAEDVQSLAAWRRGLVAWLRVMESDEFWERLRDTWRRRHESKPEDLAERLLKRVDLDAFRRALPGQLLEVHEALVVRHFRNNDELARGHFEIILQSGLDAALIARVRRRIYAKLVGQFEDLLSGREHRQALELVEDYLRIDPDYSAALCDKLRACTALCERMEADVKAHAQRLHLMQQAASDAQRLKDQSTWEQEWTVANGLRDFYLAWASASNGFANRQFEEVQHRLRRLSREDKNRIAKLSQQAFERADQAVEFERAGQRARQLQEVCCANAAQYMLIFETSLDELDKVLTAGLKVGPASVTLHALRAIYYYRRKNQNAAARRELSEAERLNQIQFDANGSQLIQQAKEMGASAGGRDVGPMVAQAERDFHASNFEDALTSLREAERHDPENPQVHRWKTGCLYHLGEHDAARSSLKTALRHAQLVSDPELDQALKELGELLNE